MNLTEIEKEKLLDTYFDDKLLPIGEKIKEREIKLFAFSPDASASTYYHERKDDGEYVHEIDFEQPASELSVILTDKDLPELAELAESLVALAGILQSQEEIEEDVSPFVYAMF